MSREGKSVIWILGVLFFISIILFGLPYVLESKYDTSSEPVATLAVAPVTNPEKIITHVATPDTVKGIYMTACVAGTSSWRESLKKLIETTELNTVVVDIKDYTGTISFADTDFPQPGATGCRVKDMQDFVDELHASGIYVIGRITVFQDPYYTKNNPDMAIKSHSTGGLWKDTKGLSYIDVGAKPYWDYVVKLAKASHDMGFDEINFDYIRYPSDGNLKDMNTTWTVGTSTKAEMVKSFFSYLHDNLADSNIKTSADLFGLVTVAEDDLGIGQVLENALPYFDYIDPMVYPSHFAHGTDGFTNPAEHPYEIIKYSMSGGLAKEEALNIKNGLATTTVSKLRPWIQDFDLGATYDAAKVRDQIRATNEVGLSSWLSWDAGNHYTPGAYLPETTSISQE